MKNQKGITLIALVITIIVLLILAGISIAMLTGDNGILTNASNAKKSEIEGTVREQINLAVQAAKLHAEIKATETSTGYLASGDLAGIKSEMEKDLSKDDYKIETAAAEGSTPATITVTYTTAAYKSATNYESAGIVATITVTNNTFTVKSIVATRGTGTNDTVYLVGSAPAAPGAGE